MLYIVRNQTHKRQAHPKREYGRDEGELPEGNADHEEDKGLSAKGSRNDLRIIPMKVRYKRSASAHSIFILYRVYLSSRYYIYQTSECMTDISIGLYLIISIHIICAWHKMQMRLLINLPLIISISNVRITHLPGQVRELGATGGCYIRKASSWDLETLLHHHAIDK